MLNNFFKFQNNFFALQYFLRCWASVDLFISSYYARNVSKALPGAEFFTRNWRSLVKPLFFQTNKRTFAPYVADSQYDVHFSVRRWAEYNTYCCCASSLTPYVVSRPSLNGCFRARPIFRVPNFSSQQCIDRRTRGQVTIRRHCRVVEQRGNDSRRARRHLRRPWGSGEERRRRIGWERCCSGIFRQLPPVFLYQMFSPTVFSLFAFRSRKMLVLQCQTSGTARGWSLSGQQDKKWPCVLCHAFHWHCRA